MNRRRIELRISSIRRLVVLRLRRLMLFELLAFRRLLLNIRLLGNLVLRLVSMWVVLVRVKLLASL